MSEAEKPKTEGATPQPKAGEQPKTEQPKAEEWKPPTREEWDKAQKALADANKEAGDRRIAEKNAKAAAEEAEKKAAQDKGEIAKVLEIERKQREEREKELAEVKSKAARGEKLESVVKAEVEELEKKLGDRAKAVAHLAIEDRLPILKQFAALALGPGAAKPVSAGAPASGEAQQIDLSKLTHEQRVAHYVNNPKAREEAIQSGRTASRVPGGF